MTQIPELGGGRPQDSQDNAAVNHNILCPNTKICRVYDRSGRTRSDVIYYCNGEYHCTALISVRTEENSKSNGDYESDAQCSHLELLNKLDKIERLLKNAR